MDFQELGKEIKTDLESTGYITNVSFNKGNYRGGENIPANIEFKLNPCDRKTENQIEKLILYITERLVINFPEASLDYKKIDIHSENCLRKVEVNIPNSRKPIDKENLVYKVANEFKNILESYLPNIMPKKRE